MSHQIKAKGYANLITSIQTLFFSFTSVFINNISRNNLKKILVVIRARAKYVVYTNAYGNKAESVG